jgi:hypothetical protein
MNASGKPKAMPKTDEERRKQADTRRPMLFRKMLMFDMDEKIDLDDLLRKQLNKERANGSKQGDGRTRQ